MAEAKKPKSFSPDTTPLTGDEWNKIVVDQISKLAQNYSGNENVKNILGKWLENVTIGFKHNEKFSPHVNGFYMIFMVHGTWYDKYKSYVSGVGSTGTTPTHSDNATGLSSAPAPWILGKNPKSYMNMMATDVDIPDITEEYIFKYRQIKSF